jgi:hypothetical protein
MFELRNFVSPELLIVGPIETVHDLTGILGPDNIQFIMTNIYKNILSNFILVRDWSTFPVLFSISGSCREVDSAFRAI